MKITVVKKDLTEMPVDAIVNPANSKGFMGGGVAAVIKKKGGAAIENLALKEAPIAIGRAALTEGGNLKAKWVIHAPTMELPAQPTTHLNIKKAVKAALKVAKKHEFVNVAFPDMGTGVGKIPKDEAAKIMVQEMRRFRGTFPKEIFLVGYDEEMHAEFMKAKDI